MNRLLTAATFVFLALWAVQVSAKEEIDAEQKFEDWAAFIDGSDCWIATAFELEKADEVLTTFYFVAFHERSPQPRISITPSHNYNMTYMLPLSVGGLTYELEVFEGTAVPTDHENEMAIFNSMLNSEQINFTLQGDDGEYHKLEVSYSGFQDSYNYVSRKCEFDHSPGLSDIEGVEPT